ncbi:MAG: putative MFS family arabinose efflux permease [Alphaproteobacteria bacterium]|jgi:predicted MFS family arabinose efflux permease
MNELLNRRVLAPLTLILMAQTTITMSSYSLPVIAPIAAADIGMEPSSVVALMTVVYVFAMIVGLASGGLIGRFGATRVFQLLLLSSALGIGGLIAGHPAFAFFGAAMMGVATGPMNPCGSSVLSRISPPRWQPVIFSLKQCGTPAGGMLAGAIVPAVALIYDWRIAVLLIPVMALIMVTLLGANRRFLDAPNRRKTPFSLRDTTRTLKLVITDPALRRYSITGLIFAACQIVIASYLVVYLWEDVSLSPAAAGAIFAVFHASGITARIVLGFFAGRLISTGNLLILLGLAMAVGIGAVTLFTPQWPLWSIYAIVIALGVSANGWVGLFLSEVARLAPEGETASATGGVQFFMYFGISGGPVIFYGIYKLVGDYEPPFMIFAVIAFVTSCLLLRGRR